MKISTTKNALLMSILSLFLCFAMLTGTTFAWFTDTVESGTNQIVAGNLDVELDYWTGSEWKSVSKSSEILDADALWEPGFTQVAYFKLRNAGSLAFKYNMGINIISETAGVNVDGDSFKLSDYIYFDVVEGVNGETGAYQSREELATVMTEKTTISKGFTRVGALEASAEPVYLALVVYMPQSVSNEVNHNGTDIPKIELGISVVANQYANESDSFGSDYDDTAFIPVADVDVLGETTVSVLGGSTMDLDASFSFKTTEDATAAAASGYRYWHADFVVTPSSNVAKNTVALAGYYDAYAQATNTVGQWVALTSDVDIAAGTQIRLLEYMGVTGNYEELCNWIPEFLCGVADLSQNGANNGKTITVELRLYETYSEEECLKLFGYKSKNEETGNYTTIGIFEHTFGGKYETLDDGSTLFITDEGDVVFCDVGDDVSNTTYQLPDGVTALSNGVFGGTSIETVTIPASVTDFGASGVSDTNASGGAFKGSNVTTIVLEEGMTEIPAAAFNGATKLTSVTIPSSVKTIGVNAFRSTAITNLTIPATVETISYGAFRDMTSLETVTFEGEHVDIPNYAFRGCTNLRTVYLNVDTATIGTNMAFCNSSSNNPNTNNITFYCRTNDIAEQVKASMGVGSYVAIYVGSTLYAEIK